MEIAQQNRPVTPTSILAAELKDLMLDAHVGCDEQLLNRLSELSELANGLDAYVKECTSPQSAALSSLLKATNTSDWGAFFGTGETLIELESEMLSGHVEGQFLKFLIAISSVKHVLEVGMFTGYATLAMAEALPEDGKIIACELDPFTADFARKYFAKTPQNEKIEVRIGSAHDTIKQLADQSQQFGLIFIDAEKSGYIDYLRAILDHDLMNENGFVVVDNTLMQGQPYCGPSTENGEAIRQFNDFVCNEDRVQQVLIPLRDGLTLIRKTDNVTKASNNE